MKITVLDGHAANPGDLSWNEFKKFGDFHYFDRTPPELVIDRINDSDAVFLNKIVITDEILSHCPSLKYIGVLATGYNVVDIEACRKRGITVTNIPSYSTSSVSQHVFAFILNFTNQVQQHSQSVHAGGWIKSSDFCYWNSPLSELEGKTLGIFGFGSIGRKVAQIAHAFGMNVIICVHSPSSFTGGEKTVSFDELLSQSDFITLHAPLTPETDRIINKESLSKVKKSAYIINTARGGLVDENAVKEALTEGKIAGYAADVILQEPMNENCPLLNAPNCILTPHIAWAPLETRQRLFDIAIDNLKSYLNGTPKNEVTR